MGPLPVLLALVPALAVLSAASWHFVEAPLDRFKNRVQYTIPSLVLKPVE